MAERRFPLLGEPGKTVPWSYAERAYREYVKQFGSRQSLEILAQRGGFDRAEYVMLLGSFDEAGIAATGEKADGPS